MIVQIKAIRCVQCKREWNQPDTVDAGTFICDACELDWLDYLDTLAPEERCPTCGQPDNCGDCTHTPMPAWQRAQIMEVE